MRVYACARVCVQSDTGAFFSEMSSSVPGMSTPSKIRTVIAADFDNDGCTRLSR